MQSILVVGLGGFLGAVGRYVIAEFVRQRVPAHPHAGTFAVNMIGCLAIGFVMNVALAGAGVSDAWKLFIVTGCLGALTTFSTFGFETVELLQDQQYGHAVLNVLGNLAVGLPAVWIGTKLGNWLGS